ncbi:MAG: DUF4339 domain-containing protein [Planctomycetia bacterium]|nr:DUF4339 domain-containing protein [Planctomycetia bacterium]
MARPLSAAPGITPGTPAATVLPTKGPNSVPFPGGSGLQPGSAPAGGFTAAPAHTALPKAGAPAAAASPAAALDPIAQAPHAVWYVRPNSGGQFGPASGDVLRQWIDQGRVAAESLVWRDGWPGWQQAAAVFPQLARGSTPPDAAPPLTAPSGAMLSLDLPASPSSAPRGAAARRAPGQKSNQMTIVIVAALALVVLGLGGVLFWVMAFR